MIIPGLNGLGDWRCIREVLDTSSCGEAISEFESTSAKYPALCKVAAAVTGERRGLGRLPSNAEGLSATCNRAGTDDKALLLSGLIRDISEPSSIGGVGTTVSCEASRRVRWLIWPHSVREPCSLSC